MRFCFLYPIFSCFSFTISFCQVQETISRNLHYLSFRVYHENDILVPCSSSDDNYTGGSKAEIITNLFHTRSKKRNISSLSFVFGYTTYTPRELKDSFINYNDRPYASYRFWGLGLTTIDRDSSLKIYSELQLGAMGTSFAGNFQKGMHAFFQHCCGTKREIPQGWHHQIADSGAFAINLNLKMEKRIWPSKKAEREKNFRWVQFSARSEINIGQYMTNFWVEPRISLVNWNHNFGEFDDEPGIVSRDTKNRKIITNRKPLSRAGAHIFIGAHPKFVFHNTTLTGKCLGRPSVHTIPSSELKKVFMEYNLGLAFRWCCLRLGYNLFFRGREYSSQEKKCYSWGGLYIGSVYRFE